MKDERNPKTTGSKGMGGSSSPTMTESFDPATEDAYWRQNYSSRDYVTQGTPYSEYAPAYRYGWESRNRYRNRRYDDVETDLERGWDTAKGTSKLTWENAKRAVRDAWHRVERAMPGDFDKDGR